MREELIKKPSAIISSLGRTGTKFIAFFLAENFKNIKSEHEATSLHYRDYKIQKVIRVALNNIKEFGFNKVFWGKINGRWGVFNISHKRMSGKISDEEAAGELIRERKSYFEKQSEKIFVESSYNYYGLLDLLPAVFEKHKAVYIIRDPREWVRSFVNFKGFYSPRDLHNLLGNRLTPYKVNDREYAGRWKKMEQFEKLCWVWNYVNNYVLSTSKNNPHLKIYSFEELFLSENRHEKFYELINFILDFDNIDVGWPDDMKALIKNALTKKINKSEPTKLPDWKKWPPALARTLDKHCGKLMAELGYGQEAEWRDKL